MTEIAPLAPPTRLQSLDAFRGITIAGMILVNNPGTWQHKYSPLEHAHWNGWTPTDLIFPFFLFIVGVSMTLSFRRRMEQGHSRGALLVQVLKRSAMLFLLGLILYGFPDRRLIAPFVLMMIGLGVVGGGGRRGTAAFTDSSRMRAIVGWILIVAAIAYFVMDFGYFQASHLRVPGVLQRIAVCYLMASLIVLAFGSVVQGAWVAVLLLGYWAIVRWVSPPAGYTANVAGASGLLHNWIDVHVLGQHLYRERPDPEGILSTIPAIATTLLGVLTGRWLQSDRDRSEKVIGLFMLGNVALVVGLWMAHAFPINKKIWTSSYVVFTAGMAMDFLAMCYWLIDVKGFRRWAAPFVVFGTNAIAVYVASGLLAKMMGRWTVGAEGTTVHGWIYQHLLATGAEPINASLVYAVAYVAVWFVVLIPFYRARIFIKI